MAVAMDQRPPREPGELCPSRYQEFAEEHSALAQPLRGLVVREEVSKLVAKDREAARLEPDHRDPRGDRGPEGLQDPLKIALGAIEHPVIVERAAAAERLRRDYDL